MNDLLLKKKIVGYDKSSFFKELQSTYDTNTDLLLTKINNSNQSIPHEVYTQSKDYFTEYFSHQQVELTNNDSSDLQGLLDKALCSFQILENVQEPLQYCESESKIKNVCVLGNMGNGKSTTCNKIAHVLSNFENPCDTEIKKIYKAGRATKSVTKETEAK